MSITDRIAQWLDNWIMDHHHLPVEGTATCRGCRKPWPCRAWDQALARTQERAA